MNSEYQSLLASRLNHREYFLVKLLLGVLQMLRSTRLEKLAENLPLPILVDSRRRKLQRLFVSEHWSISHIWWPIIIPWLKKKHSQQKVLYIALDRTQWCETNIMVASVIHRRRALPIHFDLFNKKGSSSCEEQIAFLQPLIEQLEEYNIILLGDREFCGVELAQWLLDRNVHMALRLKKNEYIEQNGWFETQLSDLGVEAGECHWLINIKVTKRHGFGPINLALRKKRRYRSEKMTETWFIMSDLTELQQILNAYSQRMGIEQMFRDWKQGGYNLEDTKLSGQRFIGMLLLVSLAYYSAWIHGERLQQQNIHGYVARTTEDGRKYSRHSAFAIGLSAAAFAIWDCSIWNLIDEYIALNPSKRRFYAKGVWALKLSLKDF